MTDNTVKLVTEDIMCTAQKIVKFYCALHNKPSEQITSVNRPVTASPYRQGVCCAGNDLLQEQRARGPETKLTGMFAV